MNNKKINNRILPEEKPEGSAHQIRPDLKSFREALSDFMTVAFLDPVCAPILKRVNRVLLWAVRRLNAYNAKPGRK